MTITNSNIEAIIFDLGRVLVAIDNTLLVEQLFKKLSTDDPQQVGRHTMSDPAILEFSSGRITAEAFYQKMRAAYQWDISFDTFRWLWCRIFYPMDDMENLVMQLRGHVKLGLLSDTDPLHWNHIITTWPWLGMFEKSTLSYQVGVMKPNPKIYLTAAKNVDTSPEKCLYIDDLENNVEGARTVGMTAVQFEDITQIKNVLKDFRLL
ncbi:MAG: HAD family phosphatase [Phycisphaerae bacterium]|nr:HAD family phosphatase [Phycisphaerae bacterium]